jgi:exodeoxyribonuclease VIII
MEPGIYTGMSNEAYHADRTAVSSTWLKTINAKTPYHLRCLLDSPRTDPSEALVQGSAVDCLIFEPELWDDQFIVAPELNLRTNDGRATMAKLKARAVKQGKMVIKQKGHSEALETAKAIRLNPRMADVLKRGLAQQVFVWRDPVTGLLCKCRTDWYDEEDGMIYDLKTAVSAAPDDFSKAIHNFRYHVQAAFYSDGVRACGKPVRGWVFAVQEKPDNKIIKVADPKIMAFYRLDEEDMEAGQDDYTSGLSAINFCMVNDEWEGYTNEVQTISRPGWARRSNIDKVDTL